MPTDSATRTVTVPAPVEEVLSTIRAVDTQPQWIKEILEVEVLEEDADGLPLSARFRAASPVGSDRYTLAYEHGDRSMDWHLTEGRLQTGQQGHYEVRPTKGGTEVTFTLTISHNLPLPGFIRRRVINGLVDSTVDGLKTRVEAG